MLRHVDERSATIWCETAVPGEVTILGRTARTFTVQDHHYALVVVEGLEPGTTTTYDVRVDGALAWPEPGSELPPSVIRTLGPPTSMLIGSCRAAAPHEPPYTHELAVDERGRGIDALWAHAVRMIEQPQDTWPTLLVLVGDQIYADDSSPSTEERVAQCRHPGGDLDPTVVLDFGEYCWLYDEAWSPQLERWLFSVVPSVMIFDDHDQIDDWNISASWQEDAEAKPWWRKHLLAGLMSYWIHQHLGNLSPDRIREEGVLDALYTADDPTAVLERWARQVAAAPEAHRFSYARHLGDVKLVVIDSRHRRVLDGPERLMVDEREWEWVREQALDHPAHLVLATPLPVFVAPGLHDLQVWNERVCGGAWSRWLAGPAERIRRGLDLEDWPAFGASFRRFVDLLHDLHDAETPPTTTIVASGDIHFSYSAAIDLGTAGGRVHQVVSSPIRNALIPPERGVMRFTLTEWGRRIGAVLRRLSGVRPSAVPMEVTAGPFFANNMCVVDYRDDDVVLVVEHAVADHDGRGQLREVARLSL